MLLEVVLIRLTPPFNNQVFMNVSLSVPQYLKHINSALILRRRHLSKHRQSILNI